MISHRSWPEGPFHGAVMVDTDDPKSEKRYRRGVDCIEQSTRFGRRDQGHTTAILSFNQVLLAAKGDATYLSIFVARMADEGHGSSSLISMAAQWLERRGYGKIFAGNIRSHMDIERAATAGAHMITVPTVSRVSLLHS